jgi:hypothetical protein
LLVPNEAAGSSRSQQSPRPGWLDLISRPANIGGVSAAALAITASAAPAGSSVSGSHPPLVRYWSRPRLGPSERARYAVLIHDPAAATVILAYGDAEDAISPRLSLYRWDHQTFHDDAGAFERRLATKGYDPVPNAPVTWLDPRGSVGRRNLARIAEAAKATNAAANSIALESVASATPSAGRTSEQVLGQLTIGEAQVTLLRGHYASGETMVVARDTAGPYGVLSVNLPGTPLGPDEVAIKNWGENAPLARAALASGLFAPTGREEPLPSGTGLRAPIWQIR